MKKIKCTVIRQHPLLAHDVGEVVELLESSFEEFSVSGVVASVESEDTSETKPKEQKTKDVKK